jgi:hypothetical protein
VTIEDNIRHGLLATVALLDEVVQDGFLPRAIGARSQLENRALIVIGTASGVGAGGSTVEIALAVKSETGNRNGTVTCPRKAVQNLIAACGGKLKYRASARAAPRWESFRRGCHSYR